MEEVQFPQLCLSETHKQNDSMSLCLSDSLQCRRGYYFRAWFYISALEYIIGR